MAVADINAELFQAYAFYCGLLVLKYLVLSPLTSIRRFRHKAFINPEDIVHNKSLKVVTNCDEVERIRRCQRNDMEIILPFLCIAWLYCHTNPAVSTAKLLFRVFTIARYVHTFVYAVHPLPQPSRALSWAIAFLINVFLSVNVILYFW